MQIDLDWAAICRNAPEGWNNTSFGSVCVERAERGAADLPLLSVTSSGLFPQSETERRDTSNEDKAAYKVVRRGDVTYNTMRMWQGRSALVDQEGLVSPAYTVFTPAADLDHRYTGFLLKFPPLVRKFQADSQGLVSDTWNLKFSSFAKIHVPLPPLPEQKKIAEILGSVDEAIRATEAVIEQTRRVKEGLLQELLTKGIGHTKFKQTEIGEIPEGWEVKRIGDVAEVRSGIAKNGHKSFERPIEVPYLRVANVQDGFLDLQDVKTITIEERDLARYRLQDGDVLMNEGGDLDKLGRGDIWRGQISPCVHQNHVFAVRCGGAIRPAYLSFLAESPLGKSYFLSKGIQTTNLASISKTGLREMPVRLPPMHEQDQIIDRLNGVRQATECSKVQHQALARLKAGLLQDLLTGKVRVKP